MEKLIYDIRNIFESVESNHKDENGASSSSLVNTDLSSSFGVVSTLEKSIRKTLGSYKSNPLEWQKYAQFDPLHYTRNLVDMFDGKYNLLILCWGPGQFSQIHDHTDSHCFVKVLQGKLLETRYAWPTQEYQSLMEIGSDLYHVNDVTYINDQIGLHRMENDSHTDGTVTLHLYSPPLEHCNLFDLRTGHRDHVHSSYYTKFGKKVAAKKAQASIQSAVVTASSATLKPSGSGSKTIVRTYKRG